MSRRPSGAGPAPDGDWRGLPPPQPLLRTLALLEQTPPTRHPLRVVFDRYPYLLFPHLDERGLSYEVEVHADGVYLRIGPP